MNQLPLPPNWTEHRAPTGQLYYYNNRTKESTYIRPLPLPIPPQPPKKKKEKLVEKIHIPCTEWLRVKTADGNIFWNHRETKKSVWVMPEEIKQQVEVWEASQELLPEEDSLETEEGPEEKSKRKAESELKVEKKSKKARVEDEKDSEGDEDEEEKSQRAMLEDIAAAEESNINSEATEAGKDHMADSEEEKETVEPTTSTPTTDLTPTFSLPEAKILFLTLLREKSIDPIQPWDATLPLIIQDPRYTALPSLTLRKEVFDEYCRERIREIREEKAKAQKQESMKKGSMEAGGSGELAPETKESYLAFLKATVTSTRTNFTDFKRSHKKDRRFYSFGRDDRERERVFKDWLKELGEIKRASAKEAERNFFELLEERVPNPGRNTNWKEVKKDKALYEDSRYDAVGSSSLRQELFEVYLAKVVINESRVISNSSDEKSVSKEDDINEKERRRQKALADRQSQVQAQKQQLAQNIDRSRTGLERESGEEIFRSLLTDAIRDPLTTWSDSLSHLSVDPRYINSPLPIHIRQRLFHAHIDSLRQRHLASLHQLLSAHSNSIQPLGLGLDKQFSSLSSDFVRSLESSLPITKLHLSRGEIEREFEKWQRERWSVARKEFDELLAENNFLEFWGKVGKSAIRSETSGRGDAEKGEKGMEVKIENDDLIGEEDEEASAKDVREMAKHIDVTEVERVLKNDKRYRMFDYIPEKREQWLRDYMQSMAAPKLSVHTG